MGHAETVIGFLGALAGLAAGWWIQSDHGTLHRHRSTGRETRNLLALTVGIFAVGPILTAVARSPTGPLALLRDVVLNPLPTLGQLEQNCGATVDGTAWRSGGTGFAGPLGLALAVVPVLLLLICADGMRRGRRLAWRITIGVQLAVTALSAVYLALFARIPHYPRGRTRPRWVRDSSTSCPLVAVPLLLAVLLWANRRQFRVETVAGGRRKLAVVVAGAWAALAGGYTVAWLARRRNGARRRPVWACWPNCPGSTCRCPSPASTTGSSQDRQRSRPSCLPIPGPSSGLWRWPASGRCSWGGTTVPMPALRTGTWPAAWCDEGGDSLSWMALWEPNRYWFTPGLDAGVAYQQHGSVALTLAGPFGDAALAGGTAAGFMRYCGEQALVPGFYSCNDGLWPLLSAGGSAGWRWRRRPGCRSGSLNSRARNGRTSGRR